MHNRLFLLIGSLVLLLLFYVVLVQQQKSEFIQKQEKEGYVFVQVLPIQSHLGWGYDIFLNRKKYIHQEFIPGIFGRRGFETKEEALRVGNRVVANATGKKGSPAISFADLRELGIPLTAADTTQPK